MNKVIVIGGDHHNTLGVIRSLGYKGIKSILILVSNFKKSYIAHSKYIQELVRVKDDDEAIRYLFNEKNKYFGGVIIACSDSSSSALDINRNTLIPYYYIPGSNEQGRLTNFMDKEVMSELGRRIGFNVPKTWIVENDNDILDVTYPCITKPILSKDGHKTDIKVCTDKEQLISLINNGSCYRYQVQQFIDKDFEYQLIGLSLNDGNDVIIPGISRCIRPCPGTNTGFLHYESLNNLNISIDHCKYFIKEVGYSGLFSIEFLRDKNGVDYFMEMNFRNDGNAICVTSSGTNLPYLWYLANTNGDYIKELESSTFMPVYVMPEFADFKNYVITRKISIIRWLYDVKRTNQFMEYDKNDTLPFYFYFVNKIFK